MGFVLKERLDKKQRALRTCLCLCEATLEKAPKLLDEAVIDNDYFKLREILNDLVVNLDYYNTLHGFGIESYIKESKHLTSVDNTSLTQERLEKDIDTIRSVYKTLKEV